MVFIDVCNRNDIINDSSKFIKINNNDIALFNVSGKFYAVNNICPHRGGSLSEGDVHQEEVSCPIHCWIFNLKSGECLNVQSIKIKTYNLKIENERILVEL